MIDFYVYYLMWNFKIIVFYYLLFLLVLLLIYNLEEGDNEVLVYLWVEIFYGINFYVVMWVIEVKCCLLLERFLGKMICVFK